MQVEEHESFQWVAVLEQVIKVRWHLDASHGIDRGPRALFTMTLSMKKLVCLLP